jgi:hypothetical protein
VGALSDQAAWGVALANGLLGGALGGGLEQIAYNLLFCHEEWDHNLVPAMVMGGGSGLLGGGLGHWWQPRPRYLGFDPEYGHRWSDGGEMYGRMSPEQVAELHRLAEKYDRNIVVAGGWAETELGVKNRTRAFNETDLNVDIEKVYGVPPWRDTGPPSSGLNIPGKDPDFDYWTRDAGRDLPIELKMEMAPLFDIDPNDVGRYMDNYNTYETNPSTIAPLGTIVFHARKGIATRRPSKWQRLNPQ